MIHCYNDLRRAVIFYFLFILIFFALICFWLCTCLDNNLRTWLSIFLVSQCQFFFIFKYIITRYALISTCMQFNYINAVWFKKKFILFQFWQCSKLFIWFSPLISYTLLKSNEKHNFMRSKTETQDTLFLTRHESGIYLIVYHEYHGLLIY